MGLKDLLATKVFGPKGYGGVMGRPAMEGGSALTNMVFMSHGTNPKDRSTTIFDTAADMKSAGFTPRFEETTAIDFQCGYPITGS